MDKTCLGCGLKLQTSDKTKAGYTPKSIEETTYCQRCYRLMNYNETPDVPLTNKDFLKIISNISKENCLVVLVVDVFNLNQKTIETITQKLKTKDTIVVLNKIDVLPKIVSHNKLRLWIRRQMQNYQLNLVDVEVISALNLKNIDQLLVKIDKYRKQRNVYFVGSTNTGKSTLINGIIKSQMGNQEKDLLATSMYSGTTLSTIAIALDDGKSLIDTPGIVDERTLSHKISSSSLKKLNSKREIRARTYQLNQEQTLFISGLVQFDFIKGSKTGFTIYASNQIDIHRTKYEKSQEIRDKHLTEMLSPPTKVDLEKLQEFTTTKLTITKEKQDIVLDGICWIVVNTLDNDIEVEITYPQEVSLSLRESIV